jgi:hypothetical protein
MVEPPSPLIVELLVEAVKAAKLSDSLLLEKDEWSDADIFSTCHLPDLIMEMERSMTPTPDTQREGEILGTV